MNWFDTTPETVPLCPPGTKGSGRISAHAKYRGIQALSHMFINLLIQTVSYLLYCTDYSDGLLLQH